MAARPRRGGTGVVSGRVERTCVGGSARCHDIPAEAEERDDSLIESRPRTNECKKSESEKTAKSGPARTEVVVLVGLLSKRLFLE
jgi:hypothetical protein